MLPYHLGPPQCQPCPLLSCKKCASQSKMYGSKQVCDPEQDTVTNNTDLVAVLVFRLFVVLLASGFKRFKALHIQNKTINVPGRLLCCNLQHQDSARIPLAHLVTLSSSSRISRRICLKCSADLSVLPSSPPATQLCPVAIESTVEMRERSSVAAGRGRDQGKRKCNRSVEHGFCPQD